MAKLGLDHLYECNDSQPSAYTRAHYRCTRAKPASASPPSSQPLQSPASSQPNAPSPTPPQEHHASASQRQQPRAASPTERLSGFESGHDSDAQPGSQTPPKDPPQEASALCEEELEDARNASQATPPPHPSQRSAAGRPSVLTQQVATLRQPALLDKQASLSEQPCPGSCSQPPLPNPGCDVPAPRSSTLLTAPYCDEIDLDDEGLADQFSASQKNHSTISHASACATNLPSFLKRESAEAPAPAPAPATPAVSVAANASTSLRTPALLQRNHEHLQPSFAAAAAAAPAERTQSTGVVFKAEPNLISSPLTSVPSHAHTAVPALTTPFLFLKQTNSLLPLHQTAQRTATAVVAAAAAASASAAADDFNDADLEISDDETSRHATTPKPASLHGGDKQGAVDGDPSAKRSFLSTHAADEKPVPALKRGAESLARTHDGVCGAHSSTPSEGPASLLFPAVPTGASAPLPSLPRAPTSAPLGAPAGVPSKRPRFLKD